MRVQFLVAPPQRNDTKLQLAGTSCYNCLQPLRLRLFSYEAPSLHKNSGQYAFSIVQNTTSGHNTDLQLQLICEHF
jgi:hypothetical protein